MIGLDETLMPSLQYNEQGLIPAIVQDDTSGIVLMMAWMNAEAVELSLRTGEAWYWSRSRQQLWHKGATSGNVQKIHRIDVDCDQDCLLLTVSQTGTGACHTGRTSCFYRQLNMAEDGTLSLAFAQDDGNPANI